MEFTMTLFAKRGVSLFNLVIPAKWKIFTFFHQFFKKKISLSELCP